MAKGPRVDVVENHSTFFRCYAFLADSSRTFSVQLSSHDGEGFGSADDLSSLFFILGELFPQNISDIGHCPAGRDHPNFHD